MAVLEESQVTRRTARSAGWSERAWLLAGDAEKIQTSVNSGAVRDQAAAALGGLDAQRANYFAGFGGSSLLFDREGRRLLIGSLGSDTRILDGTSNAPSSSTTRAGSPVAFVGGETPAQLVYDSNRQSFLLAELGNSAADFPLNLIRLASASLFRRLHPAYPLVVVPDRFERGEIARVEDVYGGRADYHSLRPV